MNNKDKKKLMTQVAKGELTMEEAEKQFKPKTQTKSKKRRKINE